MKKNSNSQSAFFNRRILIGFVLCLAGVSVALVAFGQNRTSKAYPNYSGDSLSATESPNATPTPTPAMTFTVTSTADNDGSVCGVTCTLRQAINASNAHPPSSGTNLIAFNIPSNECDPTTGVCTITPSSINWPH